MIEQEKLIQQINARLNQQPVSRIHLGGYHSGAVQAYKNIIRDIESGAFDCVDEEKNRLQIALHTHESYDKTASELHEENMRLQKALEAAEKQVEEYKDTLKTLNDYVFANFDIPLSARTHMQKILHYDLPVALERIDTE